MWHEACLNQGEYADWRSGMKRIVTIFVITTVLVLTTLLFGDAVDLTGTWVGPTMVEEAGMELTLTLTLEQNGTEITGHVRDDMGFIDCDITEAALDGAALTFMAIAMTPDGDYEMAFDVEVDGGQMVGAWDVEGMASGEWTAEKQK